MSIAGRRCTFCSCREAAEYVLVGPRQPIPLCSHHAALVGESEGEHVRPINADASRRPAAIDPRRLLVAAVAARA